MSRSLFLSALGGIYLAAFASFWLQYPGLIGGGGLLPAVAFWSRVQGAHGGGAWESFKAVPCLFWLSADGASDAALEAVTLIGLACACLGLGGVHHGLLFVVMFLCYLSLYTVGQTWLGFQWDIFLLETGAAAILYAPWRSMRVNADDAGAHPMTWVLRAQWVKFMVMSGVVKVTARCPTWEHLTALEFHFASTCLPTAEAWWLHSLPPFLLRMCVAFMFVCELLAPWLLLVPCTPVRRVGVVVQLALQVGIQATGNYNWFNLQTAALLLPAWAPDFDKNEAWERFWATPLGRWTGYFGAVAVLAAAAAQLFPVRYDAVAGETWAEALARPDALFIENRATPMWTARLLESAVNQWTIGYLYAMLFATTLCAAWGTAPALKGSRAVDFAARLVSLAVSSCYLGVTLLPLESITRRQVGPLLLPLLCDASKRLASMLAPFHVSSSYGLFRRMSGVGGVGDVENVGWGGQPPSIVEVPAVVLSTSVDGTEWREVAFRYAPYVETRAPRRTAPHQPRLDWQLWFAALGSSNHNPWLLHLVYKVVSTTDARSDDALKLLDLEAHDPTGAKFVRADLYHYDFTRVPSPWARRNAPGSVEVDCSSAADCDKWWKREKVREYLPTVDRSILYNQVVKPQGWPEAPPPRSCPNSRGGAAACAAKAALRGFVGFQVGGYLVDGPLLIILTLVAAVLAVKRAALSARRRSAGRGGLNVKAE
ncbi:lipase maturation factor-domain-containing protein [Pelagophyceae sp. CCMP2097]|nr:lipase maturation factor-domain-containing protein [Pelagophyceae sp. CCMP2097]